MRPSADFLELMGRLVVGDRDYGKFRGSEGASIFAKAGRMVTVPCPFMGWERWASDQLRLWLEVDEHAVEKLLIAMASRDEFLDRTNRVKEAERQAQIEKWNGFLAPYGRQIVSTASGATVEFVAPTYLPSVSVPSAVSIHGAAEELIDVAILTAIEAERKAVCAAFGFGRNQRVKRAGRWYWRGQLPLADGSSYEIVVAQPADTGQVEATGLTKDVLHDWEPAAALLVGIAASTDPDKVKLGDVVVGKSVWYYEQGKVTPQGIMPQPEMIPADAGLLKHFAGLAEWDCTVEVTRPDCTETRPTFHHGVIASGEKVIADAVVRDQIASGQRKIIAIAMEDYGFSRAISQSQERVQHLVIRGICDNGTPAKDDRWQEYAAAAAAAFAKHFLLDRPLEPRKTKSPPRPSHLHLPSRGAVSSSKPAPRFEILHDTRGSASNALALIRSRPSPPPYREIVVSESSGAGAVLGHGGVLRTAQECQLRTISGHPMFPMLELTGNHERTPQGLLWSIDAPPYPGAVAGTSLRFAVGLDGSFAYSEWMRETYVPNRIWGTGVGLFMCLDRLIGAALFARRLAWRVPMFRRANVLLSLQGVMGQPLAFDFDDRGGRPRNIQLDLGRFVVKQESVQVAGAFEPRISDAEVVSFAAQAGETLSYYFHWDWTLSVVDAEIRNILDNAQNRDPTC
ncbi:phosphorylase family protein [Sorangium sp. So ce388]|uniref:5'-methylthioadenosine/S-adenosylhomocysteine nucleosidase family protein n=1 Tax=Sorangium sp. So ce388 TaxID=3133309 RepID=UPI003F5C7CAC